MELFIIENNVAKPTEHVVLVSPFKEIWESDESEGKQRAIKDFTFIEFMCSPKKSNVFFGYPEDVRPHKIIEAQFPDYIPRPEVMEAIEAYNYYLGEASYSYSFLVAAREGAEKMKHFFKNYDLDERTNSGGAVYKPADVTRALKDTEEILKNIQNLEKRVFDELKTSKTKGNKEINQFER